MVTNGRQTEQQAAARYEEAGYEVYVPPKAKYREQDVFGLFDLLAFGHDRLEACQVKTNRARGVTEWFDRARVYEEHLEDVRVTFMVRFEEEGWKVYRTAPEGYQVAFDGREISATAPPALLDVLRA